MIPTTRMWSGVLAFAAVALLTVIRPLPVNIIAPAFAAFLIVAGLDALRVLRERMPAVRRRVARSLALGNFSEVQLEIDGQNVTRPLSIDVYDYYPVEMTQQGLPFSVTIDPGRFIDAQYRVRATLRGQFRFSGCDLRVKSRLGFWKRRCHLDVSSDVKVYPDFAAISKYVLHGIENPLGQAGVRLKRRRGEGLEFHQLRDYRDGDSIRAIDWNATSRVGRLIAREYQDERDQQIIFVLDTGRRMLAKDDEFTHFDHALNAMLSLAYVALKQGDAVGLLTAGPTRRWFAPRKGVAAVNGLLNHVFDIRPAASEVDYVAAATELAVLQRRRALIIFLTNIREVDSDELRRATHLLRNRHLLMMASLRERVLDESLLTPVSDFDAALTYASTEVFLAQRRRTREILLADGIIFEDCNCAELPAAIMNRYLSIKRSGML